MCSRSMHKNGVSKLYYTCVVYRTKKEQSLYCLTRSSQICQNCHRLLFFLFGAIWADTDIHLMVKILAQIVRIYIVRVNSVVYINKTGK